MIISSVLAFPIFVHNILHAAHSPDPPVFTDVQHYPCICYLPPDSGLCTSEEITDDAVDVRKLQVRYYFDTVTEKCYPFGTQNCGGNKNNFENLTKCQNVCKKHK